MFTDLIFRLRSVFRRHRVDNELDEELNFHIERQLETYIRSGLTREEAESRCRLRFGAIDRVKEQCGDARGVTALEAVFQDLRYGARMLRTAPGFTATIVATLALAVGVNTALFSVVEAVLLRPLPFKSAGRLFDVTEYKSGKVDETGVPYPVYRS